MRILAQALFPAQLVELGRPELRLRCGDNPLAVYELSARLLFVALLTKGPGKPK